MESAVRLVVQGDDLGMCHAVNEAIEQAFCDGILTQTTAMAPCGWIDEGARIARRNEMPTGMHCTLTAEWEHLRWRPLTSGQTLCSADGTFHRSVQEAIERIDPEEAGAELDAQVEQLERLGVAPTFFDCHMGPTCAAAFAHVVARHDRPFIYPLARPCYDFASTQMSSFQPGAKKLAWMLDYLDGLTPGAHFLCTHPGRAGPELAGLTSPEAENYPWAEEFRESDLAMLTDPRVRERVEQRGIELISVGALTPALEPAAD